VTVKLNGASRWAAAGLVLLAMLIGGVVYTHTQFVAMHQYDKDQQKIEKVLDEIRSDVKDLLRRAR